MYCFEKIYEIYRFRLSQSDQAFAEASDIISQKISVVQSLTASLTSAMGLIRSTLHSHENSIKRILGLFAEVGGVLNYVEYKFPQENFRVLREMQIVVKN